MVKSSTGLENKSSRRKEREKILRSDDREGRTIDIGLPKERTFGPKTNDKQGKGKEHWRRQINFLKPTLDQ